MVKLSKKSKRIPTRLRAKIEKKVREHKRKTKRDAKRNPNANKKRKDPGVPNSLPFKEAVLKEAEDRKRQIEDERQKQKERRKKDRQKLVTKKRSLDGLVKDAEKRANEFDKKHPNQKGTDQLLKNVKNVETSLKTFYKEFRKVVDAADVVLEVLDARDPLGSRCQQMEEMVMSSGTNKRLVLILNKIDLVPKENVEEWLKYLKNEYPVIAFKASTQTQHENLGRKKVDFLQANQDLIKTSSCLGADTLMTLLGNYCRNKDIKTLIRVGVVGLPNTGKSSIINSLKRNKACNVGAMPGITKQMQEVHLDKHIRLLDSPGVVMATSSSDTSVVLRNCVKLENLEDVSGPVEAILRRCNKQQMMLHYCITEYKDVHEFLSLLAVRLGRLKKGGVPDVNKAARTVIQHWNMGKINYYTHPPERRETHVSSEIVTQMGQEFDIESLLSNQQKVIDTLQQTSTKHMLVESMGPAKVIMDANDIGKVSMDTEADDDDEEEEEEEDEDEDEDDEEMENSEDDDNEDNDDDVEAMEDDEDEMSQVTVSLPSSRTRSRANTETSSTTGTVGATSSKKQLKDKLNVGLPQMNRAKKADFKKMKKQRRRRDRVAGELSDALTSAFSMTGSNTDDATDSYKFDEHF